MRKFFYSICQKFRPPLSSLEGYEHPELVEVIYQKTLAYEPQEPWPELEGARAVLDFGGGCGIHYKQARSSTVRWAVVETSTMVDRARTLETDKLRFFSSIEAAADWLGSPIDVMHSNGAVQYTPEPLRVVDQLCSLCARQMLWQRLSFAPSLQRDTQTSNLLDNGPGRPPRSIVNKLVRYTRTSLPEAAFVGAHRNYALVARGSDWFQFRKSPAVDS